MIWAVIFWRWIMAKFGRLGSSKNNKKEAMKHEKRLAKDLGGHTQPNSGSLDGMKGDVITSSFTIDHKHTSGKSYILSATDLNKAAREAQEQSREPMLVVRFIKGISLGVDNEWIITPLRVAKDMGVFDDE